MNTSTIVVLASIFAMGVTMSIAQTKDKMLMRRHHQGAFHLQGSDLLEEEAEDAVAQHEDVKSANKDGQHPQGTGTTYVFDPIVRTDPCYWLGCEDPHTSFLCAWSTGAAARKAARGKKCSGTEVTFGAIPLLDGAPNLGACAEKVRNKIAAGGCNNYFWMTNDTQVCSCSGSTANAGACSTDADQVDMPNSCLMEMRPSR